MDIEMLMHADALQKQIQEMQEHLGIINQQIAELEEFRESLSSLENSEGKEILSSLGKGVHLKTSIKEDKLFVEFGTGILVRKTPKETAEVIREQLKKLIELKLQFSAQMEQNQLSLQTLVAQIEASQENK
jgi:prefoldin alpha subunit